MHLGPLTRRVYVEPSSLPFDRRAHLPKEASAPLIGWRVWRLHHRRLRSVTVPYIWQSPAVWDETPPPPELPQPDDGLTTMGFHFYREEGRALCTAIGLMKRHGRIGCVIGTCELFGYVCEHKFGFRAQGAVVRSLRIMQALNTPIVASYLERRYRCDMECPEAPGRVGGVQSRPEGRARPRDVP